MAVLSTPYYAVTNASGSAVVKNIPPGKYRMEVWYERSTPEALRPLAREISLPGDGDLRLEVAEAVTDKATHKNKYGEDYDRSKAYGPE